ncbi:MAG: hypothetical protein GX308_05130 [Epulopiscium sp.]|nr:hypothetical protein [Candidatus Epulonipiscium sp.]
MLINKFTAGIMLGGIAGAMGFKVMSTNKRGRRKMMKNGRRMIEKAGNIIEGLR